MEARRRIMTSDRWPVPPLPSEYQRVEYVIGDNYATVIDTGVPGNNNNLRLNFCFETNKHVNYAAYMGNWIDDNHNAWRLLAATIDTRLYVTRNLKAGNSSSMNFSSPYANHKLYFDFTADKITCVVDGTGIIDTAWHTAGTDNDNTICFGYRSRTTTGDTGDRKHKWWFFRIWNSGVLIRNFIPCYRKSDNKGGFYETVNKQFYTSIGPADFIIPT